MIRNDQNIVATFGIVSSVAARICSGVASTTLRVYLRSRSP